jgi:hypothetical protein
MAAWAGPGLPVRIAAWAWKPGKSIYRQGAAGALVFHGADTIFFVFLQIQTYIHKSYCRICRVCQCIPDIPCSSAPEAGIGVLRSMHCTSAVVQHACPWASIVMGRSILLRDIWSVAVKKLCPVWFGGSTVHVHRHTRTRGHAMLRNKQTSVVL